MMSIVATSIPHKVILMLGLPCEAWMKQMGRNLTDPFDGFLRDVRYLIVDRDPLFTACFRQMLKDNGTKPVRLPARSLDLNAFAEHFVLSAARPWPGAPSCAKTRPDLRMCFQQRHLHAEFRAAMWDAIPTLDLTDPRT